VDVDDDDDDDEKTNRRERAVRKRIRVCANHGCGDHEMVRGNGNEPG